MFKPVTFGNPGFLVLLLVIPLLAVWYFYRRKKNTADLQMSTTEGFAQVGRNFKYYIYHSLYILRLLALTLLFIALARPQTSLSRQDISVEGIDLVIALDISGSMLAMDFKPDRLEAAKDLAIEFIDGRPNDRIGLVIFSGETFTQCPLTTDHAVLKNLFRDIHSGMIDDGTALGDGLATAVNRLRGSKAVSKVIILLTDGQSNMGALDPRSAAEIAKLYGIRIYTIGMGTMGQAPYPVQTPFGMQTQMMEVKIDEPTLMEIAKGSDGKYFRATNNAKLRAIYQEIDKMEKSKIDVTEFRKKKEEFLPLVLLAFIFLGLEMLLRYLYLKNIP
ncbi:MAG: VWA domain-containing protein [Bacteroidetes bacterium]|nr:VWA domain-containing protein [Bacteroidota bacterium]